MTQQANPFSEENAPRRYFEYMEQLRLKQIEELEQSNEYLRSKIAHKDLDIKSWRDRALFNGKWATTLAEIRIVLLFGMFTALVVYGMHIKFGCKVL